MTTNTGNILEHYLQGIPHAIHREVLIRPDKKHPVEIFPEKDTMERLHTLSCCYAVHKRQSAGVLERKFIIKNCFSLMNTAEKSVMSE